MIDYLVAEHWLTPEEAYVLCSLAGDLSRANFGRAMRNR